MQRRPIKRNEHIKKLSREHHLCLLFCWKIRQGLRTDVVTERICEYVQYFWQQHLNPHFRQEEKILFTHLKDRQVQRAVNEHKEIREHLENLINYPTHKTRKMLAELADMVDEHVRYEERILFPHVERQLSKEQLEKIDEKIHKHHQSSSLDQYADQFWNS